LNPKDVGILFDYATAFGDLGDSDKAKINYRRAIEINPEDAASLSALGYELQVGQHSTALEHAAGLLEAEQLYRRAILAKPGANTIIANFDAAKVNAMANLAALLMQRDAKSESSPTSDTFYDCESGGNKDLFYDCEYHDRQAPLSLPLQEAEQLLKQALIMDPAHINSLGNMVGVSIERI
jgi:tetratricopeptide (TPR) repeat protein